MLAWHNNIYEILLDFLPSAFARMMERIFTSLHSARLSCSFGGFLKLFYASHFSVDAAVIREYMQARAKRFW